VDEGMIGRAVDLYIDDEYVMSSQIGKKARVKIDKRSDAGKQVFNAIVSGQEMKLFLSKR
jgi:ATPase